MFFSKRNLCMANAEDIRSYSKWHLCFHRSSVYVPESNANTETWVKITRVWFVFFSCNMGCDEFFGMDLRNRSLPYRSSCHFTVRCKSNAKSSEEKTYHV